MLEPLKRVVLRSLLGGPARALYYRLWPLTDAEWSARYDAETAAVIARALPASGHAVDVGAHAGEILRLIVAQAPEGLHWAFEPLPAFAVRLRADFPAVRVHQVALAAVAGTATFQHVVTNPGYSGLRRRTYPSAQQIESLTVSTARLDDVLPGDQPIAFIKIDVEGGELGVLQGATRTLTHWRPVVVFEHGRGAANHYGTRPEQVYDLLAACGLRVTLMAAWLRGEADLTRAQFIAQFESGRNYYFMAYRDRRE
jgi:FkbM family methyltransferase